MSEKLTFSVNGRQVEVNAPPMRRLLDVLREDLELPGTKYGCGEGECGACTVLIDGVAVMSCLVPVAQVEGASVSTVEGMDTDGKLCPLQQGFLECGGAQCGICTPGMLVAAQAHLDAGGSTDTDSLREALAGNICRCTGYSRILESIQRAAEEL